MKFSKEGKSFNGLPFPDWGLQITAIFLILINSFTNLIGLYLVELYEPHLHCNQQWLMGYYLQHHHQ